jgi:lysophospholipid acyltransferase
MFWDPVFDHVSGLIGAPPTQLKVRFTTHGCFTHAQLISALLISFPLSSLYVRLPHSRPNLSHLFSIAVTSFFLVPLLNDLGGMLHLLFSCAVTYGIVVGSKSPNMPWVVFV